MKKIAGFCVAGFCALAVWGAGVPLILEGSVLDTSSAEQQEMFKLLKASVPAPVVQRLTSRGTAPWLVKFHEVIRGEWKTALEETGASIRGYMPENGFLVEATPRQIAQIAAMEPVAWTGEYLPAYKKAKALREGPSAAAAKDNEFQVELFRSEDKARIVRELGEMNAFVSREEALSDRARFRAWLSPQQVEDVAGWGEVEWIEPCLSPQSWGTSIPAPDAADEAGDSTAALQAAYDAGARIHLLSRGVADSGTYGAEAGILDRFVWEHPDLLVVAAAGNAAVDLNPADGVVDPGSVGSPATAKNVLSVGAAEGRQSASRVWRDSWPEDFAVEPIALDRMAQADGSQGMAAFSGRGPCSDGRIKPDLVAPGTFVAVSRPADPAFTGWGAAENDGEIYVGGTGVAAEQVAAAAGQARQWLQEQRGLAAPSAALVKALLVAGARDLAPGQYGTGPKQEIPFARPNSVQGFGRLDLAGAMQPGEGGFLDLRDAQGLATGAADTIELNVGSAGGRFVLVLAYSDFAASPAAGRHRVNDLDLTVRTPSGNIRFANGRSGPDDLNNVERIECEADEAGAYLARVEARAVPMGGSQPYALVIRGPRTEAAPAAALETP